MPLLPQIRLNSGANEKQLSSQQIGMSSLRHLHDLSSCDLSSNLKWSHLNVLTRTENGKRDKRKHTQAYTRAHASTHQSAACRKQSASAKLFILIKNKWYGCPALQPLACHSISMQIQLHGSLSIIPLWVAGRPVAGIGKGILVEQNDAEGGLIAELEQHQNHKTLF